MTSVKKTQELKSLDTQFRRLCEDHKFSKFERDELNKKLAKLSVKIDMFKSKINSIRNSGVMISEHAMLRYVERVYSINLEKVQKEMISPYTMESLKNIGTGKLPGDNCVLVLKNSMVVTTLEKSK